jgi:hypothetical protein
MSADSISSSIQGFVFVSRLTFESNLESGECKLALQLAAGRAADSDAVEMEFDGVADLSLKEFGGGVTQLMLLRARDIRSQQWDRLALEIVDREHERILFRCRSASVRRRGKLHELLMAR